MDRATQFWRLRPSISDGADAAATSDSKSPRSELAEAGVKMPASTDTSVMSFIVRIRYCY